MLEFNFQFRFADWKDKLLLTFGILLAIVQGTAMPVQILFFGGMIDTFVDDSQISEKRQLEYFAIPAGTSITKR